MPKSPPRPIHPARFHERLGCRGEELARLFAVLEAREPRPPPGELSLAFLSDEALARIHAQFLGDPTPTDVITFPGEPEANLAGEICVSVDTAARVAAERGEPFARELTLYLVHGWLHLAGYDDHTEADILAMREAERACLAAVEAAGALPAFTLDAAPRGKAHGPD